MMENKTKANIEVFASPISETIIKRFSFIEDLIEWTKTNECHADQVSINGCIIYGWDELFDFV